MTANHTRRLSAREIFRWPFWLGALMAAGLAFALFGDGGWDALSWLAMAIPLGVVAWKASAGPR